MQHDTKGELPMKIRIKGLEHRFRGTYSVIGDFVLVSIMLRYVRADLQNKCSFHSSHHCLYA